MPAPRAARPAPQRPAAAAAAAAGASGAGGLGPDDKVLLIGVTGVTGRCALDGLLAAGVAPSQLLALSRNPTSPAAAAVAARGVAVAAGDLDSPASIEPHLAAARFVYVHALSGDAASADPAELRRGAALAALLRARQGAGGGGGLGLIDQKNAVADELMASGAPFLGLEATMFMEEFWKRYTRPQIIGKGTFPFSLPSDRKLQLVSARDLGTAAAAAMRSPAPFAGRNIPFAADELTPVEMAAAFAAAQGGGEVKHSSPPAWLFWILSRDLWRIITFLREKGYGADPAACRAEFPGLLSFRSFLELSGWGDAARAYDGGIQFSDAPVAAAVAVAAAE
ncbi:hypothetical protein Rsub_03293 [Raphidocelis subcapitata]|uniref:NmrA-like domain-containing protein n=1 Tax=Raphidocelis subcapitata TaxID=307507 RepID=A0A2V0NX55_9CHLO|nr:hypothetical protein Rsub_03293 [Raphidocelis subcapitata]|eukprot:GBF90160.1 hypothetical protein Rsub_03293 [Raphidocelis subcapitata]